jgi:hypothetical protein
VEETMLRKLIVAALASVLIAGGALAQAKFGTADEAKAMLEKAVAAIKADKAKALDMFLKGEGGFKDRDLYPFCFNISDGKILVTQAQDFIGMDVKTITDENRSELHVPARGRDGARTEDQLCDESGRCCLRCWVLQVGTEGRKTRGRSSARPFPSVQPRSDGWSAVASPPG